MIFGGDICLPTSRVKGRWRNWRSVSWSVWGYGKKLRQQWLRTGQMERVEQRRGTPRKLLDEHREQLRRWVAADHDLTLAQLQLKLREDRGLRISQTEVGRALKRMGLRRKKKSLHAAERDTKENRKRREEFVERLRWIAPDKLIFMDESGVTTSMTRLYGRCLGGARIHEATPGGHWQVLTILGAMSTAA